MGKLEGKIALLLAAIAALVWRRRSSSLKKVLTFSSPDAVSPSWRQR